MSNPPSALPKLIITRFSFVGNSGWKIPVAEREKILFDPARLDLRLRLFERITLASLKAQSDQGFHHYILTSDQLPDWALDRLTQACLGAYPQGRFTIDRQPLGNARKYLRLFMVAQKYPGPVVQIVLDDDDGLACDFIARITQDLTRAEAEGRLASERLPLFLSYAKGYGLVFSAETQAPQVFLHRYPFINLGLTMVDGPAASNILAIDHLAAPRKAGCEAFGGDPMFVRSVHAFNDSRVAQTDRWKRLAGDLDDPDLRPRFAFLAGLTAPT